MDKHAELREVAAQMQCMRANYDLALYKAVWLGQRGRIVW
jgi:hypothetical protein